MVESYLAVRLPASSEKPGATLVSLAAPVPLFCVLASTRAGDAAAILAGSVINEPKPAAALRVGWISNDSFGFSALSTLTEKPSAAITSGTGAVAPAWVATTVLSDSRVSV